MPVESFESTRNNGQMVCDSTERTAHRTARRNRCRGKARPLIGANLLGSAHVGGLWKYQRCEVVSLGLQIVAAAPEVMVARKMQSSRILGLRGRAARARSRPLMLLPLAGIGQQVDFYPPPSSIPGGLGGGN